MIGQHLSIQDWLSIPQLKRLKIVKLFKLKRSTSGHVQDNRVISDGYSYEDLNAISVESLQNHLHSTEKDFNTLFNLLLASLEEEEKVDTEAIARVAKEAKIQEIISTLKTVIDNYLNKADELEAKEQVIEEINKYVRQTITPTKEEPPKQRVTRRRAPPTRVR